MKSYDAVIVGGGPNGLAAAIVLAQRGLSVVLIEAKPTLGGGVRSAPLTLPGFVHDVCSAIHPLAVFSPFFRTLNLPVEWVYSPHELAHPLDDGTAAVLSRSVSATAEAFGEDGDRYQQWMSRWVRRAGELFDEILAPVRFPRHPLLLAEFALSALQSAAGLTRRRFKGVQARAVLTGCAGHSILPLTHIGTASFGIVLAMSAHAVGWPCARGGSSALTRALADRLQSLGGEIRTGEPVRSLGQLPQAEAILFDVTPRQLIAIAGQQLPSLYRKRLTRFRYGPGVFKIDWALDGVIPWKSSECSKAMTLHLGGTAEEIIAAEAAVWRGEHPRKPFVLFAQPTLFDSTRAPAGKHVAWAYCHVPSGSTADMTEPIENQVERFAPGFRGRILARHTMTTRDLESHNENMIGGDIGGGANNLGQFLTRPIARLDPYSTPNPRIFLCSSSTPPGGGVHGMCGFWAAQSVLRRLFSR